MTQSMQGLFFSLVEADKLAKAYSLNNSETAIELRQKREEKLNEFKAVIAQMTRKDFEKGFAFNEDNAFESLLKHSESYELTNDLFEALVQNEEFMPSYAVVEAFVDNAKFRYAPSHVRVRLHDTAKKLQRAVL